jgi:hypothetical protein
MAHRSDGNQTARALAQGLGWFSVGLGLAELLAPRSLGRFLGMEEHTALIRAYGARELAAGVGILAQADPTVWMWGRVGGDALDLGTLAFGLRRDNPQRENVGLAIVAVAGVTALDLLCATALGQARNREDWPLPIWDYSHRRGMRRPPAAMRGAARDAMIPRDMRIPEPLRPYTSS